MIRSMTGFGRGEYFGENYNFKVELKAVNHRYNDISIKMPRYLNFLEDRIKKEIQKNIGRGRVDIFINLEYTNDLTLNIDVDLPVANASMKALNTLKEELDIKENISVSDLMKVSDVIKIEREIIDEDEIWDCLSEALNESIKDVISMKEAEGKALKNDMIGHLELVENLMVEIEKRGPIVVKEHKEKLETRIADILDDGFQIDQEKLALEVAMFADKSNIDEEITRMDSHVKQFYQIVEENEPVGRKLDFLIQEMNREINTIGSKSGDIEITQNVVEVKSEIEKVREQVQNVE